MWEKQLANEELRKHVEVECQEIKMNYGQVRRQIEKDINGFHALKVMEEPK